MYVFKYYEYGFKVEEVLGIWRPCRDACKARRGVEGASLLGQRKKE